MIFSDLINKKNDRPHSYERSRSFAYNVSLAVILDKADNVTLVNNNYFRAYMLVRNDYMVDHSDLMLAIWNGEQSCGTWHTIQCAKAKDKQVDIIKVERKSR